MKKAIKFLSVIAIVAVLCALLVACTVPDNADKAAANLEKHGYNVSASPEELVASLNMIGIDGVDKIVTGSRIFQDGDYEAITLVYFNSAKEAKAAYDKLYTFFMRNAKDDDEEVKRDGKVIYCGTDDAIEAVKKS